MRSGNMKHVGTPAFDYNLNDSLVVSTHEQLSALIGNFNVGWNMVNGMVSLCVGMGVPKTHILPWRRERQHIPTTLTLVTLPLAVLRQTKCSASAML